jgi:hypothetical protein
MEETNRLAEGSAAKLLSDWRAAERDAVAARASADVADLASHAAERAARAAQETAESAKLALEAATSAERAARETAEAARILATTSAADKEAASDKVTRTEADEADARDAFHEAQDAGFPAGGAADSGSGS